MSKLHLFSNIRPLFATRLCIQNTRCRSYSNVPITEKSKSQITMNWPTFFATRRRLQLYQRFGGIPFVFAFWVAEGMVLSLPIFDPTKTIFDMDPMVVVGLASVAGSLGSYFIGASLVGLTLRFCKSSIARQLDLKQKDFYARISKHRANVPPNPTQMNFNFDYYGEKVHSMADYRWWLRRQRQLLNSRIFPVKM